jgi:hypothetical protein
MVAAVAVEFATRGWLNAFNSGAWCGGEARRCYRLKPKRLLKLVGNADLSPLEAEGNGSSGEGSKCWQKRLERKDWDRDKRVNKV